MATISSPGIGSGLDVQSIVSQLVALEKAPIKQLQTQATSFQTRLSTYGNIKSQVSALSDAASKLASVSGWNAVTASSTNTAAVSVTASAGAPVTSLTLEVQQLARSQSTASSAVPTGSAFGSGTLTIELGSWASGSFVGTGGSTSVTIEPGRDSLTEIASRINGADGGVTATVLKDASGERLLMRSKATGEEQGFRVLVSDADGDDNDAGGLSRLAFNPGTASGMALTQAGLNAQATVNNIAITSASNDLTDTLPGMTLRLQQVTTSPVEISVGKDTEDVRKNITALVDAYNAINTTLSNATRYNGESRQAGALQGDSTAVGLQNALRGMMRSITAGAPFERLSDIGIELQTNGAMTVRANKLDAALTNLDGLRSFFTIDNANPQLRGFGQKIKTFSNELLAVDGLVTNRTKALQSSLDRNSKEQERIADRAARAEVRLLAQYNAMDNAVGKLNGLNAFVNQQITLWNRN